MSEEEMVPLSNSPGRNPEEPLDLGEAHNQMKASHIVFLIISLMMLLVCSYVTVACIIFVSSGPTSAYRTLYCYLHTNKSVLVQTTFGASFPGVEKWISKYNVSDVVAHRRGAQISFIVANGNVCRAQGTLMFKFTRKKEWYDHVFPFYLTPGLDDLRTIETDDKRYTAVSEYDIIKDYSKELPKK